MKSASLDFKLDNKKTASDLFERGFKAWCENTSNSLRKRLELKTSDPLSPYILANYLDIIVLELNNIPNLKDDTKRYLGSTKGDEWSAVTVSVNKKTIVIVNPTHSSARKNSNLMHELSHLIRNHTPGKIYFTDRGMALRNFDDIQEAEANWLAGVLLLPRDALSTCIYRKMPLDEILSMYGVSKELYNYRVNVSGVRKQFKRFTN